MQLRISSKGSITMQSNVEILKIRMDECAKLKDISSTQHPKAKARW